MTDDDNNQATHPPLSGADDASWERVGRAAVADRVYESGQNAFEETDGIADALYTGGEIDADDVRRARIVMNEARRVLEEYVAPTVEGTGAWEDPLPAIPPRRLRDSAHHPDIDPEETDE